MENFCIRLVTELFVLIEDTGCGKSITNDASRVVSAVASRLSGGLGNRRLYYRDSMERYDELKHCNGNFLAFAPCTPHQQSFLKSL